jgi:hypothetical protein
MNKKKILNLRNVAAIVACLAVLGFASCDKENKNDAMLPGQVFVTPAGPVAVGNTLVAVYTEGDIPEEAAVQVSFQWKKGSDNAAGTPTTVGNQSGYTPTTTGEYSVVVSAPGYQSKTSNVVVVTENTGNGRGTNVASKYRGVYPSTHEGVGAITLNLGENSINWAGNSTGSFADVSTGSDKTMTWALGGSWAYLYSGNNKIGIVWRYSAYGVATLQNILIGHDKVQQYQLTILSSMGITSVDISDIAETVPDIEGEIES